MPQKEPKNSSAPAPEINQHGPDLPYWLPSGSDWNGLPSEIREAVPRILAPAYKKFVLDAPGELERSLGLTLVHLIWLEVCDHVRMALAAADSLSLEATLNDPDAMIARHLNLISAKCQTTELLVKLRLVTEALNAPPALSAPFAATPASTLPSPFGRGVGGEGPNAPTIPSNDSSAAADPYHLFDSLPLSNQTPVHEV